MTGLDTLKAARAAADTARVTLESEAQGVLDENFTLIFKNNPTIQSISFGVKSSEYNDEGMYPGIAGPVVSENEDGDSGLDDYESRDWLYDYNASVEPRVQGLKATLDLIGEDILTQIYGDEYVVTASRKVDGFRVTTDYASY